MSEVKSWSTTAASNNSSSPDGFPEGMAPSGVNDSAREVMAALARMYDDIGGANSTTGSSNAYALAASATVTAYAAGDLYTFKANHTNTGASTIDVDSVGTKNIFNNATGAALVGGEIISGGIYTISYDGAQFMLLNASTGRVVQSVEATPYTTYTNVSTVIDTDDTIPQSTEGAELTTVSITPKNTTNRLVIEGFLTGTIGSAGAAVGAIFQDSATAAIAVSANGGVAGATVNILVRHEMASGTTSSTTFKLRAGPNTNAANLYVNGNSLGRTFGGIQSARLRVTEYS